MITTRMNQLINVSFRKWCYKVSGLSQLGLWRDDILNEEEDADVNEALRRLPGEIRDLRTFRIIRAMQLSACHRILPEEQWTKYEEDVRYLKPYLDEVIKERKEKEDWEAS